MRSRLIYIRIIFLVLVNVLNIGVIVVICEMFWVNFFSWHELEFEYVGDIGYNGITEENEILGTAPPYVYWIPALQHEAAQSMSADFWFYEVRNEQEWKYFYSLLDMQDVDFELDFDKYYVISINRELTGLQYNDARWNIEKYGSSVRPDFNMGRFEEGKVYVYQLKKNITFYYNERDWFINRYNLNRRVFFRDAFLGADGYEPY